MGVHKGTGVILYKQGVYTDSGGGPDIFTCRQASSVGNGNQDLYVGAGDLPELLHKQEIYIQEDKGKAVIMRLYGNVYRKFI